MNSHSPFLGHGSVSWHCQLQAICSLTIAVINVWSTEPIRKGNRRSNHTPSPVTVCEITNCFNMGKVLLQQNNPSE